MRFINEIVVHCSATKPWWMENQGLAKQVAEITRWHMDPPPRGNGWSRLGYHFLIGRNGQIMAGTPIDRPGIHTRGRNKHTIGICLIGGFGSSAEDRFFDHFTVSQDKALRSFLRELQTQYPTIKTISGHNQYAAKACPGFNVPQYLAQARPQPTPPLPRTDYWGILRKYLGRR